jgi:methylmalonyl-CoA/ethylmalonyl-CoA epimerase
LLSDTPAPGVSLHHVGVVVADVATACADYVRRFGFEVRSDVVHDATQTAYVQFLRMPGDSTYVELVAPDGPGSALSNALSKGGGLNHLCYATPDIETTIASMTARGMRLIRKPVPAVAFGGRRIAWLAGRDFALVELVERGGPGEL